ncbi:RiboL-PSP-HEPN domain-containing protein OS=Streptomyces griseorubiginosus OX=67304 GN=AQJ54_32925 PE=4 SV=1 [Streptomyces griseorubiginosus]
MNSVISAHLGRNLETILLLEAKAISQMSVNSRISLLEEIMQQEGWDQDFPFVVPVLRAIFAMRNKLAHSVAYGFDLSVRSSVRRGSVSEESIPIQTITGLSRSAHFVTNVEMSFLQVRALPESYWTAD